jgi:hypothetical protein
MQVSPKKNLIKYDKGNSAITPESYLAIVIARFIRAIQKRWLNAVNQASGLVCPCLVREIQIS